MQFEKWTDLDISKGRAAIMDLGPILFSGDNHALKLGVHVYNGTEPVTVTGSVAGSAIIANGQTITPFVTGKDGNAAWVEVPQAALVCQGRIEIFLRVSEDDEIAVSLYATGTVKRTTTGEAVNPGTVIPDIGTAVQECVDATAAANDAAADATAAASHAVRYDEAQTLTDAEKLQARTNIGAAGLAELPLTNVLLPQLNINGTHADTGRGRTVTVLRNAVTYKRTASNSTGRAYVLTGDTFRNLAVSGSYAVSASDLVEADFIALPECISEAWARRVYLWLYSPDNANLTLYNSTTAQQNRVLLATRAQGGTIYMDNSGAGRPWGNRGGGFFAIPIASTLPELWAQMVTDRTLAVYYICKTNNSAKDGTLYWGIGVADHDLTAIPDAPAADGTYTLKVTVADGVPTYAWVSETTGLMAMSPMSAAHDPTDESEE